MIILKSSEEIDLMRQSNQVVANVLKAVSAAAEPGITTAFLDRMAEDMCLEAGCRPAFKGYHGYPFSLCCSVNEQVVHGFPNDRPLQKGDILSMDFGVIKNGFYGDSATTVPIGEVSAEAEKLMDATRRSLYAGIEQALPDNRLGDISAAVQKVAEEAGFGVVRQFVGHGIGRALHEDPQVPNFGKAGKGVKLRAGMVLAIEPMVNVGAAEVKILPDGWTAVTVDGKLSAHFEHTVAITENGPRILSLP